MNTLEEIKEELLKRGMNTTNVSAKAIPYVLDIVTESDYYTNLEKVANEVAEAEQKIKCLGDRYHVKQMEYEREFGEYKEDMEGYVQYIQDWYQNLTMCETPQGRDAMRAAQVFANSVNIQTCYDNNAFIIGLASILAGKEMAPIDVVKKIVPKTFDNTEMPPKRKEKDPFGKVGDTRKSR